MSSLDLKEYQKLALRTKAASSTAAEDYLHTSVGLLTEAGEIIDAYKRLWFYKKELDVVNIKEEIGDILWYLALGFNALGQEFPVVVDITPETDSLDIPLNFILGKVVRFASNPSTYALCYPKEWDTDTKNGFEYDLENLLGFLNVLAYRIGLTLPEAAYLNIEKLAKRYPEGFTEFHALNRDTVKELSHISAEPTKPTTKKEKK